MNPCFLEIIQEIFIGEVHSHSKPLEVVDEDGVVQSEDMMKIFSSQFSSCASCQEISKIKSWGDIANYLEVNKDNIIKLGVIFILEHHVVEPRVPMADSLQFVLLIIPYFHISSAH